MTSCIPIKLILIKTDRSNSGKNIVARKRIQINKITSKGNKNQYTARPFQSCKKISNKMISVDILMNSTLIGGYFFEGFILIDLPDVERSVPVKINHSGCPRCKSGVGSVGDLDTVIGPAILTVRA
jgi:hypothetical protein